MKNDWYVIGAAEAEALATSAGLTILQLLPSLVKSAQALASAPISNFRVGAVGVGSSGSLFFGFNIEFPGLPLHHAIHAEQFLIANLFLNSELNLSHVVVSAAPCGHCRQFFQELRHAPDIQIMIAGDATSTDLDSQFHPLSQLLPHRFGPSNLLDALAPLALEPHDNNLSLLLCGDCTLPNGLSSVFDDLKLKAMEAVNKSHAPYSLCPSGVALMANDGSVHCGSYIESAAYNPSLGPVQAALVAYEVGGGGGRYERIVAAVLVEKADAIVRQESTARLILQEGKGQGAGVTWPSCAGPNARSLSTREKVAWSPAAMVGYCCSGYGRGPFRFSPNFNLQSRDIILSCLL